MTPEGQLGRKLEAGRPILFIIFYYFFFFKFDFMFFVDRSLFEE